MNPPQLPPSVRMLSQPPPGAPAPLYRPAAILWLGILDVVFGVWGCFSLCIGSLGLFFRKSTTSTMSSSYGSSFLQRQSAFETGEAVNLVISLITTTLIIIAGIQLLRQHRKAVAASNRYAWASIVGKVLSIILPIMAIGQMSGDLEDAGLQYGSLLQGGIALFGLLTMAYPVTCLILLNQKPVKDWLAVYGT